MGKFAANTDVSTDRSRDEIQSILMRYGAEAFSYAVTSNPDRAMIQFVAKGRQVRFILDMPDRNAEEFTTTPGRGLQRTEAAAFKEWEQACKQRWRALALVVKAKLEAIDTGIATFEEEFLAYVVLPNGQTAGEWMGPQIQESYDTGTMPQFLPELGTGS